MFFDEKRFRVDCGRLRDDDANGCSKLLHKFADGFPKPQFDRKNLRETVF